MNGQVFLRTFVAFGLLMAAVTTILVFSLDDYWRNTLARETERDLREKTVMFAQRVEAEGQHALRDVTSQEGQAAGARATVIDLNGNVLADSEADSSSMGSVSTRPEFDTALHGRVGTSTRSENRVGVPVLFVAVPIQGGAVRLAYPLADAEASISKLHEQLWLAAGAAFLVSLPVAYFSARFGAGRPQSGLIIENPAGPSTDAAANLSSAGAVKFVALIEQHSRPAEDILPAAPNDQQQLETLLNSMQDAVIAVGPDGRVQWANQEMRELTQRVRLQAPLVETVRDPELLRAMKEAAETKTVRGARAISIVSGKTFDVTAAPMPDGGAVAVLRDLTERELLEKTRRDFIANVSHELRTPLTSIQGYSETLLDTIAEDSPQREFLEIIRKNAARMARLTEDLLALARVESGEQRFDLQPVLPGDLLREAAQNFAETAGGRDLKLEIKNEVADETSQRVLADRDAIHHIFGNLLENAIKYGGTGQRIVMGARPLRYEVEFYVQDFGQGIPSEHLPRLFERFYRVDKARSRESGGTGLGLSIAKHIVLAHDGMIRAESELHHGAKFLFTLPFAPEGRSDEPPEPA